MFAGARGRLLEGRRRDQSKRNLLDGSQLARRRAVQKLATLGQGHLAHI